MKSILLLSLRNFGDAAIALGVVQALHRARPQPTVDVLTRPPVAFLFENHPGVRAVYRTEFPIGTLGEFRIGGAGHLAGELLRARRRGYDAVANLFGDVRENLAGRLICPRGNYAPVWPEGHAVRRQSRVGPESLLTHPVPIGDAAANVYSGMNALAAALGGRETAWPAVFGPDRRQIAFAPVAGRIGLHVSAGQECRRWPLAKWRALAELLLEQGREVRVYCAPGEEPEAAQAFAGLAGPSLRMVALPLERFLEDLGSCSALVAHDSFGIHAAAAIGVPGIMINGANVAEVWAPPGTRVVRGDEALACFPCFNKPVCTVSAEPFACIRRIGVGAVYGLVELALEARPGA